jgi:capsular polysaccharide biosynthesis protein
LSLEKQIEIFSSANIIISPTGSALANIVFCKKGTKVVEIMPKYKFPYEEKYYKSRYFSICKLLGLKYFFIEADSVQIDKIDENKKKFIDLKVFNNSNFYKNLLVKEGDFKKFIDKI